MYLGMIRLGSFELVRCKLQGPASLSPGIKHLWSNKYNPYKQAKKDFLPNHATNKCEIVTKIHYLLDN